MLNRGIENTVAKFIADEALLSRSESVGVALSGGADSVALLLCLHRLGYDVAAVHCNFHLRETESDRDERFCRTLCERLGIMIHVGHYDTRSYAAQHGVSIEMAAREQRYAFFASLRRQYHWQAVCVAHHADDNVETMLINLIRGTGLRGLSGMRVKRDGIVRPMLCVGKKDIEAYLEALGETYVTDSTNSIPDVLRNKVRLQLLPMLNTWNPNIRNGLLNTMSNLAETEGFLNDMVKRKIADNLHPLQKGKPVTDNEWCLKVSVIDGEYMLHSLLSPYGFRSVAVRGLYQRLHQRKPIRFLSGTHECALSRGMLYLWRRADDDFHMLLSEGSDVLHLPDGRRLTLRRMARSELTEIPTSSTTACLDGDCLEWPLEVRRVRDGDAFSPLGMEGRVLIGDLLTNTHTNPYERRKQCVVTDAHGRICWVIGRRIAHPFRITDATQHVVLLEVV